MDISSTGFLAGKVLLLMTREVDAEIQSKGGESSVGPKETSHKLEKTHGVYPQKR